MAKHDADPTEPMRLAASRYPEVDEGTACTQSAFRTGKKSFFFAGPQGGRFKAMFKLGPSLERARALAAAEPDRYEVGSSGWVTVRFHAAEPLPAKLWKAWLDESYQLSRPASGASKGATTKGARSEKVAKRSPAPRKPPRS